MGKHGDESQSKSGLPQSSYLKKRQLCFTSELPNTQHWPPAYAQQQHSWLTAHLHTVHESSCHAKESQQPPPTQGFSHPRATDVHSCSVPSQQEQIPGTCYLTVVSALPGEIQTANITRLVFLAAAERRLQDPARSCKCNRMGWGKSLFLH